MTDQFDFSALEMPKELTPELMDITPEIAEAFLQFNVQNRKINERHVREIARALVDGEYLDNGEAIKLSWPIASRGGLPILLDGQHRLQAIVDTGITVKLLVVRGLDPRSQATMDTGRKRTGADWLRIKGEREYTVTSAVLSAIWKWDQGDKMLLTSPKPTPLEQWGLLERHPEIRRSRDVGIQTNQGFPDLKKTSLSVAHYILNGLDPVHAPYFFRLIGTGEDLKGGHPVLALRKRATSYRYRGEPMLLRREVGLVVIAWNKCVEDDDAVTSIIHAVEKPVPEPLNPMGKSLRLLTSAATTTMK
jgi:hypothetical protein